MTRARLFLLLVFGCAATSTSACAPDESSVGGVFVAEPGLAAAYFDGRSFERPSGVYRDANIDFDGWELNDRIRSRGHAAFGVSIRWTGQIRFEHAEVYTLSFELAGRVRIWIDDALIIDDWVDGAIHREPSAPVPGADRGWRDLRVEWDQLAGPMTAILRTSSASQAKAVVLARDLRHLAP